MSSPASGEGARAGGGQPIEPEPIEPGPTERTVVAVPVGEDGQVGSWGRAHTVAIASVYQGTVSGWEEWEVGWDVLHDTGSDAAHHARVARFLKERGVQAVVAHHMGGGMRQMLERMHLKVDLGASGEARQAALLVELSPPAP